MVGKGDFIDATKANDLIYAVTNVPSKSAYALVDSSNLYISSDSGKIWKVRFTFPFFIRDVRFVNSQIGIAIGRDQKKKNSNWTVFKTSDGGLNWDFSFESKSLSEPIIHQGELWYFYQLTDDKWEIRRRNILNERAVSYALPLRDFYPYKFLINSNDQLFVTGTSGDDAVIYAQDNKGNFNQLPDFRIKSGFPIYFNRIGSDIYIIVGILNNGIVNYKCFLYSGDGKWSEEQLAVDNYLKPVYFGKDKIWGYSGAGRIQIRE